MDGDGDLGPTGLLEHDGHDPVEIGVRHQRLRSADDDRGLALLRGADAGADHLHVDGVEIPDTIALFLCIGQNFLHGSS